MHYCNHNNNTLSSDSYNYSLLGRYSNQKYYILNLKIDSVYSVNNARYEMIGKPKLPTATDITTFLSLFQTSSK